MGTYADIVSGTKKEKRPELLRLLSDCAAGSINLVMTKSVSRFARNTTDLLEMVRSLTANYKVEETRSPDGYILAGDNFFYIKVESGKLTLLDPKSGTPGDGGHDPS